MPQASSDHRRLRWLDTEFTIHRLGTSDPIPDSVLTVEGVTITRSPDELSIVAPSAVVVDSARQDPGWAAFVFEGVLEFSLTGILVGVAAPLAEAGVSVFATSTFDTDYVMVKQEQRSLTEQVLTGAGYRF